MSQRLVVIGSGRAGTSVAAVLAARAPWSVVLVARDVRRRVALQRWLARRRWVGELRVVPSLADALVPAPDAVVAAVPDRALGDVAGELALLLPDRPSLLPIALHLSGAREPDALAASGALALGSLHPLAALPDPVQEGLRAAQTALRGALAAIAGDPAALDLATALARDLQCLVAAVPTAERSRYHAAAALAANDLLALVGLAERHALLAGLDPALARRGLLHLSLTALQRAAALTATAPIGLGLTGAAARGDRDTLARHLAALRGDPEATAVHRQLTATAAELAHRAGRLDAATAAALAELVRQDLEN